MEKFKVIINGEVMTCDNHGYVYGFDVTGRECRSSFHSIIADHIRAGKQMKITGSGCVYILHPSKDTIDKFSNSSKKTDGEE